MKTIDKRIGIDDLVKRIGQVYRSDEFVRVIKQSALEANKPSDLVFDYDFTQLFKTIECRSSICHFSSTLQICYFMNYAFLFGLKQCSPL